MKPNITFKPSNRPHQKIRNLKIFKKTQDIKYYFVFNSETHKGRFWTITNYTNTSKDFPVDGIEISLEKRDLLLNGLNAKQQLIYLDEEGQPQLRDKATKLSKGKWVKDNSIIAENKQNILRMQAHQLLRDNDFRWNNQIRYEGYSIDTKKELKRFYNELLGIIRGSHTELPTLNLPENEKK